jgi:1,4-dihydroxy-2-naphthoyl-CoA hydrolase
MTFEYELRLGMSSVDAAGVLFYPELFRHTHDAYEAFMADRGLDLAHLLREGRYGLPIARAEADYLGPLRHGEQVRIKVEVSRIGERSFTIQCELTDSRGHACARVTTVHVCVDRATGRATALPEALRLRLGQARPAGAEAGDP